MGIACRGKKLLTPQQLFGSMNLLTCTLIANYINKTASRTSLVVFQNTLLIVPGQVQGLCITFLSHLLCLGINLLYLKV